MRLEGGARRGKQSRASRPPAAELRGPPLRCSTPLPAMPASRSAPAAQGAECAPARGEPCGSLRRASMGRPPPSPAPPAPLRRPHPAAAALLLSMGAAPRRAPHLRHRRSATANEAAEGGPGPALPAPPPETMGGSAGPAARGERPWGSGAGVPARRFPVLLRERRPAGPGPARGSYCSLGSRTARR